jgi:PAS domain-containing protein
MTRTGREVREAGSVGEAIAAARAALQRGEDEARPRAAIWQWDLASDQVEWDARLLALFGYPDRVTDAAWRRSRIHPDDRERVELSLQRATIVNHGSLWSDQYRFRRADGFYATVTERAFVVADGDGPRVVVGAVTPAPGRWARPRSGSPASIPRRRRAAE